MRIISYVVLRKKVVPISDHNRWSIKNTHTNLHLLRNRFTLLTVNSVAKLIKQQIRSTRFSIYRKLDFNSASQTWYCNNYVYTITFTITFQIFWTPTGLIRVTNLTIDLKVGVECTWVGDVVNPFRTRTCCQLTLELRWTFPDISDGRISWASISTSHFILATSILTICTAKNNGSAFKPADSASHSRCIWRSCCYARRLWLTLSAQACFSRSSGSLRDWKSLPPHPQCMLSAFKHSSSLV